jgi:DNA segregation ATPase FtsK/SpoIIIE-like protein
MIPTSHLVLLTRHQIKLGAIVAVTAVAGVVLLWILYRAFIRRGRDAAERAASPFELPEEPAAPAARPVDAAVANVFAKAAAQPGDARTLDDLVDGAVRIVTDLGGVSVPALQRRLEIDFATATDLVARLEADGYVGPAGAGGKRKVLQKAYDRANDAS